MLRRQCSIQYTPILPNIPFSLFSFLFLEALALSLITYPIFFLAPFSIAFLNDTSRLRRLLYPKREEGGPLMRAKFCFIVYH